jgi:hypothetical protein
LKFVAGSFRQATQNQQQDRRQDRQAVTATASTKATGNPAEPGWRSHISVSANAESFCVDGLSHQVNAVWELVGGRESLSVVSQMTFDGRVETNELKPLSSPQQYL